MTGLPGGEKLKGWRRLAFAAFGPPSLDPTISAQMEVDAGPTLAFIERARAESGEHVTITHVVLKAVARAIATNPAANVRKRLGRLVPNRSVDISVIVGSEGGGDQAQAGVTVAGADAKSVVEMAREVGEKASMLREAPPPELGRMGKVLDSMPLPVLRQLLRLLSWLAASGVDLTRFGLPEYGMRAGGFGSALVSPLGMLGIDHALPLLPRFSRVPLAVMVGRLGERPAGVEGQVVARPAFELSMALDHRFVDGWHAGKLAGSLREFLSDPAAFA